MMFMAVSVNAATPTCKDDASLCGNNSYIVMMPKISEYNKSMTVSGNNVTVTWMMNYFTTGEVVVEGKNFSKVFSNEKRPIATYHVVSMQLPKGKYTLKSKSKNGHTYIYGKPYTVEIK
jgi:hypothetical protein